MATKPTDAELREYDLLRRSFGGWTAAQVLGLLKRLSDYTETELIKLDHRLLAEIEEAKTQLEIARATRPTYVTPGGFWKPEADWTHRLKIAQTHYRYFNLARKTI
mgnify:FL=1